MIDFLCLDDAKSLIKVPLCALLHLELHPHALDQLSLLRSPRHSSRQYQETPSGGSAALSTRARTNANKASAYQSAQT